MDIIDAIRDPKLFGSFLGSSLDSWRNWLIFTRALMGIPIKRSKYTKKLISDCTGRDIRKLPKGGFDVALFLTGRRSGKSRCSAIFAAWASCLAGLEKRLAKGEKGMVPIICPSKSQGRIIKNYLRAIFETPLLRSQVVQEDKGGFTLKNDVRIEILAGDFRSVRGFTILTAICDEICFMGLTEESRVRSDTELIRALLPALATCKGRLIAISSPYARKGWAWNTYQKHWGNDDSNVLVVNGPSRTMNPTLRQSVVDDALKEDYEAAKAEYLGEFRDDVGIWLPRELLQSLVVAGREELLPMPDSKYRAFVDVSGGRRDGAAIAIGHKKSGVTIIDFCKLYKAPFNPNEVIASMCAELNRFGLKKVTGDQYGAEFVNDSFLANGIKYVKAEKPKSQLYSELVPVISSNKIELLDNTVLIDQLAGLERRTRSGGKDIIDHPPGSGFHDDLANAVAGCAYACSHTKLFRAGAAGF